MKGKYSAHRSRLALLIICAVYLSVFPKPDRTVHAESATRSAKRALAADPTGAGIEYTFTNSTSITIPQFGASAPYPSEINVSNVPIQLAKVTVRLNAMSHTFPADVDIMLVGPQGQTAVIMSDVGGGTDIVGANITLDNAATVPMTANAIVTGTYIPTNSGIGDVFPAPAPANSGSSSLTVFEGTNPNGTWKLYAADDLAGFEGVIAGGWTLTLTAAISGQNTGAISIPESGAANPYPSEINIADHNAPVSRVVVTLTNFGHSSPDDVDVLLVSPSGRGVVLMSDVGGSTPVSNLNVS